MIMMMMTITTMMMIMAMSYDDQNLDQGNRQIAMRIVGGGGWRLVFRNNLSICFYQRYSAPTSSEHLFQSVSPTNHPPMLPFLNPSIHPSLLVNLSTPYLAVSQRSARDVDDQPVEKQGVNIHQEHRVQSDR